MGIGKITSSNQMTSGCFLAAIIFNSFGLKLFIDTGSYDIISPLFYFHFIVSLIIPLIIYKPNQEKTVIGQSILMSLMSLPTFSYIYFSGNLSLMLFILYLSFLFAIQLSLVNYFKRLANRFSSYRFYGLVLIIFLWGTNFIIESIPLIYTIFAPLTISYHFALITEGILHLSTLLYILFFVGFSYGINYEPNRT